MDQGIFHQGLQQEVGHLDFRQRGVDLVDHIEVVVMEELLDVHIGFHIFDFIGEGRFGSSLI